VVRAAAARGDVHAVYINYKKHARAKLAPLLSPDVMLSGSDNARKLF
jgi:hypothetical protein